VEALEEDGGERAGLRDREVVGTLEEPPGSLSRRLRREVRVEVAHELGEGELAQDVPVVLYLREVGVEEVVVPSQGRLDAEVPHEVAVRPPDHEVAEGGDKLPPRRSDGVDLGGEPNESLAESTTSARIGSRIEGPGASCSRAWVWSIGGSVMIALHVFVVVCAPTR